MTRANRACYTLEFIQSIKRRGPKNKHHFRKLVNLNLIYNNIRIPIILLSIIDLVLANSTSILNNTKLQ